MTEEQIEKLSSVLKDSRTLKHLGIYNSKNLNLKQICESLKKNKSLEELLIQECSINDEEVKHLREMLKENNTLKSLNLSKNYIGYKGAKYLSQSLFINQSLKSLCLSGNYLGDKGIEHLSNSLKHNQSIENLYITYNAINQNGKNFIVDSLKINSSLINCQTMEVMSGNMTEYRRRGYQSNFFVTDEIEKFVFYNQIYKSDLLKIKLVLLLMRRRKECCFSMLTRRLVIYLFSFLKKPSESEVSIQKFKRKKRKDLVISLFVFSSLLLIWIILPTKK